MGLQSVFRIHSIRCSFALSILKTFLIFFGRLDTLKYFIIKTITIAHWKEKLLLKNAQDRSRFFPWTLGFLINLLLLQDIYILFGLTEAIEFSMSLEKTSQSPQKQNIIMFGQQLILPKRHQLYIMTLNWCMNIRILCQNHLLI